MSEPVPEPPRPRGQQGGGGNVFTHKIGPLPMWAWVAIIGGLFLAWRVYSQSRQSQQQPSTTPSTPADQVPQFVNQTFTTVTAPENENITVKVPDNDDKQPKPPHGPPPGTQPWVPPPQPRPSPPRPGVKLFPPPTGLRTTSVGSSNVGLQWNTVPSGSTYPASYTVAIYDSRGHLASESTVSTPDATGGRGVTTVTGLNPFTSYHANVWANGGAQAPQHASVSFRTT